MNSPLSSPIDEKFLAGELLAQLLKDLQCGPGQVIPSETCSRSLAYQERGEDTPLIILPKAMGEVVARFRHVSLQRRRLEQVFNNLDGLELDIQEEHAIQACFTNCRLASGWETFRRRFPRTRGILKVSCPAFTSDFSQAMIEYAFMGGAPGACCLYQREDGEWRLVEKKGLWIA